MKINKLFIGVMAAGMFCACSEDVNDPEPVVNGFNGDGYMAINIQLPSTAANSRALNDEFDDGTSNEYKVESGALILFTGTDESTAVFHSAYNLEGLDSYGDADNDNITTSFLKAVKVNDITLGTNKLYGLVMLNYKDVVTINQPTMVVAGQNFTGTFAELLAKTSNSVFYSGSGKSASKFFMTNAPLSSVAGGATTPSSTDVSTLVVLNGSLKDTEAEAKAAPAGSVLVERAVAKATLSGVPAKATITGEDGTDRELEIASIEWSLSNTEAESYIVRNLGNASYIGYASSQKKDNHRFVGTRNMDDTPIEDAMDLFRIYWCIDPAYSTDKTYDNATSFVATDVPLYCHENTFDVKHQNYRNTTRAVFKVVYKIDGEAKDFYTVNDIQDVIYTDAADVESQSVTFICRSDDIHDAITKALNDGQNVDVAEYVTVTFADNAEGMHVVSAIDFNVPEKEIGNDKTFKTRPVLEEGKKDALIASVNGYFRIAKYTGGANYYDLRFMHFASNVPAQDLAPWSSDAAITATTDEAYPGLSESDYLGRYGMVRNNWYDVRITDIKHLGSPAVPDANVETPDDNKQDEKWISFKINILSWAKRTQEHEF